MIVFDDVSVWYDDAGSGPRQPVLVGRRASPWRRASWSGGRREGSGKSTLLGCINGLVPHFTGGTLPAG